jgi:hypothetical protein
MKCSTSAISAKKYPNTYMIWAQEIAALRANPNQTVDWFIDNKFVNSFTTDSIFSAIDNREGVLHSFKDSYWLEIPYSKLITNTQGEFPFIEAQLLLKSKNDRIVSFNASDLGLVAPKQHSVHNITFELESNINVVVPFVSNRASETTLAAPIEAIPRGIKLPKVGSPIKVKVKI